MSERAGSIRRGDEESEGGRVDLDLVVPALNEEERIGATVRALVDHLRTRDWRSRILVVDNGSVDDTSGIVDRSGLGEDVDVEVIGCRRAGKGAAVRTGVARSDAPWVGYCDADLSTPVEDVDRAVGLLREGYAVVVGSRRCLGARYVVPQSLHRRMGSRTFAALTSGVVGAVTDTQCGFKFFHGDTARRLFPAVRSDGFAFDVELLAHAVREQLPLAEIPVQWSDRAGSTFRPVADGVRCAFDVVAIARRLRALPVPDAIEAASP